MNPLARDPQVLAEFRERVERREWSAARRLGIAMQLHRIEPQRLFEHDDAYLLRLANRYAPADFAELRRRRTPRGR